MAVARRSPWCLRAGPFDRRRRGAPRDACARSRAECGASGWLPLQESAPLIPWAHVGPPGGYRLRARGRGLEGVLAAFAAKVGAGQAVQLVVDQRQELVHRVLTPLAEFLQETGHLAGIAHK